MDLAEVLADEDARWAEMHELIGRLTPEQLALPGYYRERTLEALREVAFPVVTAQASASRSRMRHALVELREPSTEATWWIRKAGPDHYAEHLPRLREWVEELRSS